MIGTEQPNRGPDRHWCSKSRQEWPFLRSSAYLEVGVALKSQVLTDREGIDVLLIPVRSSLRADTVDVRLIERKDGVPALLGGTVPEISDRR